MFFPSYFRLRLEWFRDTNLIHNSFTFEMDHRFHSISAAILFPIVNHFISLCGLIVHRFFPRFAIGLRFKHFLQLAIWLIIHFTKSFHTILLQISRDSTSLIRCSTAFTISLRLMSNLEMSPFDTVLLSVLKSFRFLLHLHLILSFTVCVFWCSTLVICLYLHLIRSIPNWNFSIISYWFAILTNFE